MYDICLIRMHSVLLKDTDEKSRKTKLEMVDKNWP